MSCCFQQIDGLNFDLCAGQLLYLAACDRSQDFITNKSIEAPADQADNQRCDKSADKFLSYVGKALGFIAKYRHMLCRSFDLLTEKIT